MNINLNHNNIDNNICNMLILIRKLRECDDFINGLYIRDIISSLNL